NLIAEGFPENLEPVINMTFVSGAGQDCLENLECQLYYTKISFNNGINSFAWSPNSQEIAFAAQIDCASSDIYLYNIKNQLTQRVTNEIENIGFQLEWSPNGKKILYTTNLPSYSDVPEYLKIADITNIFLQNPEVIDGGFH